MKTHAKTLRFAIYARVSTEQQAEHGGSLDVQESELRKAVTRFGGEVAAVYKGQEHATPGYTRNMFDQMLHDVETGKVNAVIVVDASRWTRDSKKNADAITHLQKHGAKFYDVNREYVLDNDEDLLILGMFSEMHRYVARLYAKKAKFTRLERARRGWPHSGEYPYGRVLQNESANRQATNAIWELDQEKYRLARKMYHLYIKEGQTWGQLGKTMRMNPETVRRILQFQSGSEWVRRFNDPTTGSIVEVRTPIPPLLTAEEINLIKERAKENQMTRSGWADRKRHYPLAHYVRCSNPACGGSSLSGHQTYDKGKAYSYYKHLTRNRHVSDCVSSVSADLLETEILSRLGSFLSSTKELESAIHNALAKSNLNHDALIAEQKRLTQAMTKKRRALDRLTQEMARQLEENPVVADSIREMTSQIANEITQLKDQLLETEGELKIIEIPADLNDKISEVRKLFKAWNGKVVMHWPPEAQRLLVKMFFGPTRPRFDRKSVGVKANDRGIFVRKVKDDLGEYWVYEAKGLLGDISGALTGFPSVYDRYYDEHWHGSVNKEELGEIARSVELGTSGSRFRVSLAASIRARW